MKTLKEFKKDVTEQKLWNAKVGFWLEIVYTQYKRGKLSYEEALKEIAKIGKNG